MRRGVVLCTNGLNRVMIVECRSLRWGRLRGCFRAFQSLEMYRWIRMCKCMTCGEGNINVCMIIMDSWTLTIYGINDK